jgi:starch-binding outer membrane protein, SusD/RagB family
MKNKISYFITLTAIVALASAGCKKSFLSDMKSYDKFDENVFTNEVQTGWYIDRMYNYYFGAYKSPTQSEGALGAWNEDKTRMTEEIGGTIGNWLSPNRNLQLATEADGFYGATLPSSGVQNNPYTRIRFANFLIEKIDGIGKVLPESFRKTSKGQMYFLRGWQYYSLVRTYGGVPIELKVSEASMSDESIRTPRSTATQVFAQITKDFDSAAALLPAIWPNAATNYGRMTSAAALAMKSRVLLTAASPLYNTDWDNPASPKWQAALDAGLKAEADLTAAGYGLYGNTAKQWSEMTFANDNAFNKEAIIVNLLSNTTSSSTGANNGWENAIRPKDYNGAGGVSATKDMLDLFPMDDGKRPTAANGYVDTFFFVKRDPRFYRTFAFSGEKWGRNGNANKTTYFYRWRQNATAAATYYGGNATTSPAVVRKGSNPNADSTIGWAFSGTDLFEYRYAELLLNIAECYAAKGDVANCVTYLGKIRARVGIPSANSYGIGTPASKYAAIEAVLYERRVELAYEGKRFWDIHRWLLFDGSSVNNTTANTVSKLGLTPLNGNNRTSYYWQTLSFSPPATDPIPAADRNILVDPDNATTFTTEIEKLRTFYKKYLVMTKLDQPLDRENNVEVKFSFKPNYYISGLNSTALSINPWLQQSTGWMDYSGAAGSFNPVQ